MKLGLVQLRKAGVMIDSQTIAEAWNVPNYGTIEGNTVLDRWEREQEMQLEHLVKMQLIAKELGIEVPGGGGNGAGPPGAAKPGAGKQNPEGRPPTGQAPPRLVNKEGGARSTITESR